MSGTAPNIFYDGKSNARRQVELRLGPKLEMLEDGATVARWDWSSIRKADGAFGKLRLRNADDNHLARLEISDEDLAARVAARCERLHVEDATRRTATGRIVLLSLAAAVSIIFVGLVGVPYAADRIAPLLPQSFDNRLGEMVDGQVRRIFGSKTCSAPEGREAFSKLVGKIEQASGIKVPVRAQVLHSGIKNAIALPGGRVYFFKGLLDVSRSPDEVAGVLAHELGHVHHRDGMRKLLQASGTSFLLGLLFGDITGAGAIIIATETLLDKAYTRGAEERADGFAINTMKKLGRSAAPMGQLLVRVTGKQKSKRYSFLASHPFSEDRLSRMRKAMPVNTGPPLLSDAEWKALKAICR